MFNRFGANRKLALRIAALSTAATLAFGWGMTSASADGADDLPDASATTPVTDKTTGLTSATGACTVTNTKYKFLKIQLFLINPDETDDAKSLIAYKELTTSLPVSNNKFSGTIATTSALKAATKVYAKSTCWAYEATTATGTFGSDVKDSEKHTVPANEKPTAAITGPTCAADEVVVKVSNPGDAKIDFTFFKDAETTAFKTESVDGKAKDKEIKIPVTAAFKLTVKAPGMETATSNVTLATDCVEATITQRCDDVEIDGGVKTPIFDVLLSNKSKTLAKVVSFKITPGNPNVIMTNQPPDHNLAAGKTDDHAFIFLKNGARFSKGDKLDVIVNTKVVKSLTWADCSVKYAATVKATCSAAGVKSFPLTLSNTTTVAKDFVIKVGTESQTVNVSGGDTKDTKSYTVADFKNVALPADLTVTVETTVIKTEKLIVCPPADPTAVYPVTVTQVCAAGSPAKWDILLKNNAATTKSFVIKVGTASKTQSIEASKDFKLTQALADLGNPTLPATLTVSVDDNVIKTETLKACAAPDTIKATVTQACVKDGELLNGPKIKLVNDSEQAAKFTVWADGEKVEANSTGATEVVLDKKSTKTAVIPSVDGDQFKNGESVKLKITESVTGYDTGIINFVSDCGAAPTGGQGSDETVVEDSTANNNTQVLGEQVDRNSVLDATIENGELAYTGLDTGLTIWLGVALMGLGIAVFNLRWVLRSRFYATGLSSF